MTTPHPERKPKGLGRSLGGFLVGALLSVFAAPALPHPERGEPREAAAAKQEAEDEQREPHLRRFLTRRRLELR